ncbi:hypothetical protein QAY67_03390 [Staphylococcus aureus]
MTYGSNQSVNLDFSDITSAYVVMVNTKFNIQIAKAQHLFKWLLSSTIVNQFYWQCFKFTY